jgi:hypothetical protein
MPRPEEEEGLHGLYPAWSRVSVAGGRNEPSTHLLFPGPWRFFPVYFADPLLLPIKGFTGDVNLYLGGHALAQSRGRGYKISINLPHKYRPHTLWFARLKSALDPAEYSCILCGVKQFPQRMV